MTFEERAARAVEPPEDVHFVLDVFDAFAEDPARVALWRAGPPLLAERTTYWDLAEGSRRVAAALGAAGAAPEEVLLVAGARVVPPAPFALALLAGLRAGAVVVPLGTAAPDLVRDVAARLGAGAVVGPPGALAGLRRDGDGSPQVRLALDLSGPLPAGALSLAEILRRPALRVPAAGRAAAAGGGLGLLAAVPGTGPLGEPDPGGILYRHDHRSLVAARTTAELWLGVARTGLHRSALPLDSPAGLLGGLFACWALGAAVCADPLSADPAAERARLEHLPVRTLCAPAELYATLADRLADCGVREATVVGSEDRPPRDLERWGGVAGVPVRVGFGDAAVFPIVAQPAAAPHRPGSLGRELPGAPLEIDDDAEAGAPSPDARAGASGEIAGRLRVAAGAARLRVEERAGGDVPAVSGSGAGRRAGHRTELVAWRDGRGEFWPARGEP